MNEDCIRQLRRRAEGPAARRLAAGVEPLAGRRYPDRQALAAALGKSLGHAKTRREARCRCRASVARRRASSRSTRLSPNVQRRFFDRTRTFLRDELRCQALLTDCNGWTNPVQLQAVRAEFDYVDDHFYVDHPQYLHAPAAAAVALCERQPGRRRGAGCRDSRLHSALGQAVHDHRIQLLRPRPIPRRGRRDDRRAGRACRTGTDCGGTSTATAARTSTARRHVLLRRGRRSADAGRRTRRSVPVPARRSAARQACGRHHVHARDLLACGHVSRDKTPAWQAAGVADCAWAGGSAPARRPRRTSCRWLFPPRPTRWRAARARRFSTAFRPAGWLPAANGTDLHKRRIQSESGDVTIDAAENVLTLDTPSTAGGFAPAGQTH